MIPKTHTVLPFLLAMLVAVAGMPTNVFQVCRKAVGTLEIEPWLERSSVIARAVSSASSWMIRLLQLRAPAACAAAVLLALMVADLSAGHATLVAMAIVPVFGSVESLQAQRAALMAEVNAFRGADNSFGENLAAATAKMDQIEAIDTQIRAAKVEPTPATTVPALNADAIRAEAATAERARIKGITDAVRLAQLGPDVSADMVGRGISLEAARAEIFAKLAAKDAENPTRQHVSLGEDAGEKSVRGAVNWLLQRSGMAALVAKHEGTTADKMDAGEFRGMTLLRMGEHFLSRAGQSASGLSSMDLAGRAMSYRSNYQNVGDFGTALENAMHKVLRAAYAVQADTWSAICGTATVTDFRAHNWYRMGNLSVLETLNENGEFKNKTIPDAEKATMTAGTRGNIIAITRQVIVNDDIGFVMRLTEALGRAGKLTIEKAFYTSINLNSGLGPTQSNSQPLFHSSRSNINTSAAAITVASIEADRAVMRSQMDPNSQDYLDLQPSVLLVPLAKRGDALTINDAQFDPADNKFQKPNTVRGLFKTVVDSARISGTRRYLFADPSVAPVWVVSFLEGQREPVLETEQGWRTDGVEMKARLDFGLDVVDYRGAVTNAGA